MKEADVLILGASGFLGRHLAVALADLGLHVRLGSRRPSRQAKGSWVAADVLAPHTLGPAMRGARVVVNLVHLMDNAGNLVRLEQQAAWSVRKAAEQHGVEHIVYLGGPRPEGAVSSHLAARLATGEVLRDGPVPTTELRAAMVIGAHSESFRMVRDLAMRLPVMALPRWLNSSSSPVGVRDVVAALVHAVTHPEPRSAWYNLPGPERLPAEAVLARVAGCDKRSPLMFRVPMVGPRLSSLWLGLVTDANFHIARKLVEGLRSSLSDDGPAYWSRMPDHTLQPLDEAICEALAADTGGHWAANIWEQLAARLTPDAG
ncbi:MAG: NAD(P)H-binding protein [Myxococcales bacterium]|nr:NAD(P)H-binding protein [Myxococcales bacterium]